jgi:hypothetical protein
MDDPELDAIILRIKQQFAKIFTSAVQRQAEGSLRNIQVVVDPKNKIDPQGFLTVTPISYGKFQDLGTGKNSGNPNKNRMYKEESKMESRFSPPRSRRFSRGNRGGIRASFYQSIPASLFIRYEQALTKALIEYTQKSFNQVFP